MWIKSIIALLLYILYSPPQVTGTKKTGHSLLDHYVLLINLNSAIKNNKVCVKMSVCVKAVFSTILPARGR